MLRGLTDYIYQALEGARIFCIASELFCPGHGLLTLDFDRPSASSPSACLAVCLAFSCHYSSNFYSVNFYSVSGHQERKMIKCR